MNKDEPYILSLNGKTETYTNLAAFQKNFNETFFQGVKERIDETPVEKLLESMFDVFTAEFGHKEIFYHCIERLFVRLNMKMSDDLIKKFEDHFNSYGFYEYFRNN